MEESTFSSFDREDFEDEQEKDQEEMVPPAPKWTKKIKMKPNIPKNAPKTRAGNETFEGKFFQGNKL